MRARPSRGWPARHDLRYATQPITEETWATAFKLKTTVPSDAGTAETLTATSLPGGTLYIILQAGDEMHRLSPLSNAVIVKDSYISAGAFPS